MKWAVMTPEARVAYISDNPQMPYSLIADALQTTKGAIAGYASRFGIKRYVPKVKKAVAPKAERRTAVRQSSPSKAAPRPALPALQCEPVTLMERRPHQCEWPVWGSRTKPWTDPKATADVARYCGAQKAADGSYCQAHAEVARDTYQPSRARVAPPAFKAASRIQTFDDLPSLVEAEEEATESPGSWEAGALMETELCL
jgi:hypothetical protein